MMKKKRMLFGLAALLALSAMSFANGLNLNSLGTKALTMGGAFVGLADDFSAIFWNPAGLANFKNKTFGVYGTDIIPSGTYQLTVPGSIGYYLGLGATDQKVIDTKTVSKTYLGGLAAYIHPVSENLVAAIGVYTPSGLGANWDGSKLAFISGNRTDIQWTSKVGLVTIAPTLAYKINDTLSIGASLNINYGMFDLAMYAGKADINAFVLQFDMGQYKESETGWGLGATFGVQFKPSAMFSLGATFRTESKVKFSGNASISNLPQLGVNQASDMKRELTWPMWLAGGMAFKPMDDLTITADLQWTQWSKIKTIETTYTDPVWTTLMAASHKDEMAMYWQDALQIRFGAEYRLTKDLAVRGGYYFDPSPAPDRTMNILLPNYDFNVLTFGLGYSTGGFQIDAGLEYLMGKDRTIDFAKTFNHPPIPNPSYDPNYASAVPGVYGMTIIAPNISISYKF
ncbi:MAG: outer membrane protein transport protein [Candidatus Aminicenantales bacterium]